MSGAAGGRLHARVSVHSICFPGAGLDELLGNWARIGVRRVCFDSDQLRGQDLPALRARLDAAGRQVETLTHVFHAGPLSRSAKDVAADRKRLSEAIDMARVIGARSIYMLTGSRGRLGWEAAAELFSEAVAPCRDEADRAGVALAIENTSAFHADLHLANSLHDAVRLAEQAGIGVCIDIFAGWTESGLEALIERAMPICRLLQLSDYVYGDRSLPCRAVPGDGVIPLKPLVAQALKAGYAGGFDMELLGPRIDAEGHVAAVGRAARALSEMLGDLGA